MTKPIHVKPAFYSFFLERLKDTAETYGYNLVVHGNLDMDLILIPWHEVLGDVRFLIEDITYIVSGHVMEQSDEQRKCFPHGRERYVVNLNRAGHWNNYQDGQYYFNISVIPHSQTR